MHGVLPFAFLTDTAETTLGGAACIRRAPAEGYSPKRAAFKEKGACGWQRQTSGRRSACFRGLAADYSASEVPGQRRSAQRAPVNLHTRQMSLTRICSCL